MSTFENFLFHQLERKASRLMQESDKDTQDSVTLDVPLFIRLLELAREDIKTDVELHQVVERTLAIKDQGTLTMDDYQTIAGTAIVPVSEPQPETIEDIRKLAGLR